MYSPTDSLYKKAIEISGVKATINNIDTKILIKNANAEYGIDYKKIISSTSFKQGDYVFINGVQYLIVDTEEQMSQSIYNVGTFRKVNHVAKFVVNETIYQLPCISKNVTKERLPIAVESAGIIEGNGIWSFIAPLNDVSMKIKTGKRFLINGNAWSVVSTDYTTQEGIFYTILKQGSISLQNDDTVNGVADGLTIPTYNMSLDSSNLNLYYNDIHKIISTCTKNGVADASPIITYSSSDNTIATVSSNGYITVQNKAGSATITITYHNVSTTVIVNASEKPHIYNITLPKNTDSVYMGDIYQLNPTCRMDGEIVSNPVISYSSNNTAVASINGFGMVTLLSQGTCNIICSYNGISTNINLTVNVHIYEITLAENSTSIIQDGTYQINAVCKKDNIEVSDPNIVYSSSDSNIATVSNLGEITAVNIGNVDITCVYAGVSTVLSITVNAKPVIHSYTISLLNNVTSLYIGDTLQLNAVCKDNDVNVVNPIVSYSSDNINIATIDATGMITSVNIGTCNITSTFEGISDTLSLEVKEIPHIYSIALAETSKALFTGHTHQIVATCLDNGTTVSSPLIVYTSSDTSIATVDSNGLVQCVASGTTTITATYENVSATLSLTITVEPVKVFTEHWNQTTTIKQYVTSPYTVYTSTDNGLTKVYPDIDYVFDSAGQSLITAKKIIVTKLSENSFQVKNALITTTTTCHVQIKERATGYVISNTLLTFVRGI